MDHDKGNKYGLRMVICQQAQDWDRQGPKLAPFGPLV